jgi:hypothetical protein
MPKLWQLAVLCAALVRVGGSSTPCAEQAARATASFVSLCNVRNSFTFGELVTLYACVSKGPAPAVEPVDAVVRALSPDSVVGQAVHTSSPSAVLPIDFDTSTPFEVASFRCTPGTFSAAGDVGEYSVVAVHEFSDWLWQAPWNSSLPGFGESLGVMVQPSHERLPSDAKIFIHGHGLNLPRCTSDFRGSWRDSAFVPSFCTQRRPSHGDMLRCLDDINGTVHFIANSHTRRTLKSMTSNLMWCAGGSAVKDACVCEDSAEDFPSTPNISRSSQLNFHYWEGLHNQLSAWYIPYGTRVVFFAGLEAWDHAKVDIAEYQQLLPEFLALAKQRIEEACSPVVVFKTAPYFCCSTPQSNEAGRRRYTAKRGSVMNAFYRRSVHALFPDAIWWDTRALTEALPLDATAARSQRCGANHIDSQLCAEDALLLRGALCTAAEKVRKVGERMMTVSQHT